MKTLPVYFGSTVQDTSVALPLQGATNWLFDWGENLVALYEQARRVNVDRCSIILPRTGLVLNSGQQAVWQLSDIVNPLLQDFGLFIPVLIAGTGVGTNKRRVVPDGTNHDLFVDITTPPGTLTLKNNTGGTVTYYGFVMFVEYSNYLAGGLGLI